MKGKPQLILDMGGVLVTNLGGFWKELAASAGIPYDTLRAAYKRDVREALWSGAMNEGAFWAWLRTQFPAVDEEHARHLLDAHLRPLPAMEYVKPWSRHADIHVLSNHRAEWIEPVLTPIKSALKSITVSSEAGCCKPDAAIYQRAAAHLDDHKSILYIDDQKTNLHEAERLGWTTLLADAEGDWVHEVLPTLLRLSRSS